jgi:hypothetical protein
MERAARLSLVVSAFERGCCQTECFPFANWETGVATYREGTRNLEK